MMGARVRLAAAAACALIVSLVAASSLGHSVDSASLSLTEVSAGRFLVRFQANSPTLQAELRSPALFPARCHLTGEYLDCGQAGLAGAIEFPWLAGSLTRVMVDIEWLDHTRLLRIVTASRPSLAVYGIPVQGQLRFLSPIIVDYTRLGIEHILTGLDHLLFVVALTLVEASIALSIVLVCAECLRSDQSLAKRAPWLVAFTFGLLHGLGFASALLAIGLPQQHVPVALLFFNVGVELGQLAIIVVVTALVTLAKRAGLWRTWLRVGVIYAMGTVAAGWSLERLAAVIGR